MTDWQTANLAQRAHRDAINEAARRESETEFEISSGNVFADLGLPDADQCLVEAGVRFTAARKQVQAAEGRRQALAALARDGRE